jgi:hypothetical protein
LLSTRASPTMNGMKPPTYSDIATEVHRISGFVPKTCWIAHVKADFGLTTRAAPNRIDAIERRHPCPPAKREAIVKAMRRLRII